MLKKMFYYPSQHLITVIPLVLLAGFIVGSYVDVTGLMFIMPLSMLIMVYPTMIGFKVVEFVNLQHWRVLLVASLINFLIIPGVAYLLGTSFLQSEPEMFAGLALASLLPTSGMTISWTMLNKGNVPAAVKITALSLIAGSLLTPGYLYLMVGQFLAFDLKLIIAKLVLLVFVPMILGNLTYRWIKKKYTEEEYQQNIKPVLPSASVWGMLIIIFYMVSRSATTLWANPGSILTAIGVLLLFYLINFVISTTVGRLFFKREESLTLVYSTVMRNLSIALGIAISLGPTAGLILTLAFIIQVQSAAWYGKLARGFSFFKEEKTSVA